MTAVPVVLVLILVAGYFWILQRSRTRSLALDFRRVSPGLVAVLVVLGGLFAVVSGGIVLFLIRFSRATSET